ncbi:MAG: exosortase [Isosphaeraceae bacterium]|nr:MAG: exosortase [Isosphaeraceae bacterium]
MSSGMTAAEVPKVATPTARSGVTEPRRAAYPLIEQLGALWSTGDRLSLLGGAAALGLLAVLFWPSLNHLVYTWSTDENYSHGFLVPLLSLYFANEAARRGPVPRTGGIGLGTCLLAACLLGRALTLIVPIGVLADLSFLMGLAGIVATLAGTAALRRYGFALFFLIFMVPLPIALYSAIASPLQRLVSRMGATLLNAIGIPVLTQGNMMTLPGDVHLFVAEACSGMRQLTGFLALTTAVAYLGAKPAWYRMILIVSSVPIAISANVLRVAATAWLAHTVDPAAVKGPLHTFEGLVMMGVGLAALAFECAVLNSLIESRDAVARPNSRPRWETVR